ncbi:MAG: UbiD family decarboxylase, partial [Desulfobacterales bacterium]|nr:UbiD family decarboxylase [Desulfobacterales bacterium]
MGVKDLRSFLEDVKKEMADDFVVIKKEIDPNLHLPALVMNLERQGKRPVLLFENVKGTSFPVLTNLYAKRERLALAMGTEPRKLVQTYLERLRHPVQPVQVATGPVKEVVRTGKDVNLLKLPQIVHHEKDAAAYITGAIALAKDPKTKKINASFNRLMIKGQDTFGIHLTEAKNLWDFYKNAEADGSPLEVAFVIGNHPCWSLGALHVSAGDENEMQAMNSLLQEPMELTPAETIDLLVPSGAEMVIEAQILAHVREDEGPFGEFTGYSLGSRKREVVKVKAVCRRKDAIFHDIMVG